MSKREKKASGKERGGQGGDFVLDFLYSDHRRIGSFLAQFEDFGLLERITHSEASQRERVSEVGGSLGPPDVAGIGASTRSLRTGGEASERVYDPLWANALHFLDLLAERGMIQRNIAKAGIGQFVLFNGSLQLVDLSILQNAWSLENVRKLMTSANTQGQQLSRQQRRHAERTGLAVQDRAKNALGLDIITLLPHTIQATIRSGDQVMWFNLNADYMAVSTGDIMLKHGVSLPGSWQVLGILDAKPESITSSEDLATPVALDTPLEGSALVALMTSLAPAARQFLGRPEQAYGATPLLIFRELRG